MVMRKVETEKKQEMTHKLLLLIKEINFESIYFFYLLPQI